jgi:hypothetical protein
MIPMLSPAQFNVIFGARFTELPDGRPAADIIAGRVYQTLGLPVPKTYVFPSPLSAMLALPHLSAFHKDGKILDVVQQGIVSRNGLSTDVDRRFRTGGQMTDAFLGPVSAQINPEFLDRYTDLICSVLRDLGGEAFLDERKQAGLLADANRGMLWFRSIGPSQVWWWPFANFFVMAEKPAEIHTTDRGLHREDGPAVLFKDGYRIYALSGVPVSERIILHPETITIDEVMSQGNAEIRRVLIMKMGPGEYLKKSGAVLVDMDSLTLTGSAPRALIMDKFDQMWLIGTDGSTARVYSMAVPDWVKTCREAHNAISGFSETNIISEA